jgi:hypothetical protein
LTVLPVPGELVLDASGFELLHAVIASAPVNAIAVVIRAR